MAEDAAIEQPDRGILERDAPCSKCGYNLRGLPADSICPECAHPIAESLRVDQQPLGTRRQLRHLWWGLLGAAIAYLVWLATLGGYGILDGGFERTIFMLVGAAGPTPWISAVIFIERPPRSAFAWDFMKAVVTLAQLAWVAGVWLATINHRLRPRRTFWVILLRFSLVAGVVLAYATLFNTRRAPTYPRLPIICVLLNLAAVVGTALWLGHIAQIARMRWLRWLCVALAVASLAAQALVALAYWREWGFYLIYAFAAIAAMGLAQFVAIILLLWRIWRYKRQAVS